ncbi:transcriptional regulator [Rhodococcus sp. 06-462-5]|uniref:winged helix-turn-helix transcriptional regulator n=1 Tax=Nocardiaceae TaxID=85025 RepID=UPI0009B80894|nr:MULTISPECIES: helix-turn-helix domain-containing protein [Rhodococcus]OZC73963.1 transcriptional regulator [Rhodococcus sp. 06-462-5]OZE67959.1 transcriptional regulator [Rhodococcus sp. 02-925g]OZF52020.1 transcriptional regulator [Rhodococcus sp. 14-1411-2a]
MQRSSFDNMGCPIANALEQVGEWWTLLILRDALDGFSRFDEFERNLGIAPNMLTRRLTSLVETGLLERRPYNARPRRYEYVPTQRGREITPVIVALYAWGNKHVAPEHRGVALVDDSGEEIDPVFVDRRTGRSLGESRARFVSGPAASDALVRRLDPDLRAERRRRSQDLDPDPATDDARPTA